MSSHFAVTVLGVDRPGIVAAVTGVLTEQGCNLEDTSMTILRGQFAMMVVVDAGADRDAAGLEASLDGVASALDLIVVVRPIGDFVEPSDVPARQADSSWTVAVYGADRHGIVSQVAALLAERSANIVDLSTRVIGHGPHPGYAMVLEITIPESADVENLGQALEALAGELGVSCSLHPSEADIL